MVNQRSQVAHKLEDFSIIIIESKSYFLTLITSESEPVCNRPDLLQPNNQKFRADNL
jgi:hypothetical protein